MATKKDKAAAAAATEQPTKRKPMAAIPPAAPALAETNQSTAGAESTQEGAAPHSDVTNTSETTDGTLRAGSQTTDNTGEAPAPDDTQQEGNDAGLDISGASTDSVNRMDSVRTDHNAGIDHAADDAEQDQLEEVALVAMCREEPIHEGGPTEADVHPDEVGNWLAMGWVIEE